MIKNFFFILFFSLFFFNKVYACNLKVIKLGTNIQNFSDKYFVFVEDKAFKNIILDSQYICNDKDFLSTQIFLRFFEEQLIGITFERVANNDRKLLDYAIRNFGDFTRSLGFEKNSWIGTYQWKNQNDLVVYEAKRINSNLSKEILVISNKINSPKIIEHQRIKNLKN
jgi:hypothetical protein